MTLSSWSTASMEEVAAAAPDGYRWFQLYVYRYAPSTYPYFNFVEVVA